VPHERPNLPALTGLRFVAALGVVFFHRGQDFVAAYGPAWLRPVAASGYVGVSLFFVLSGFILAYTYFDRRECPPRPRPFYEARLARIYPVYLLGLAIALPFGLRDLLRLPGPGEQARAAAAWGAETLLLQGWHPETACGLNCPGWSLSVEVFFYALFPFLGFAFYRSVRAHLALLPLLTALAVLPPALYHVTQPDGLARVDASTHTFLVSLVKYNPLLHLPEFLLGIVVAGLHFAWRARSGPWTWPLWPALIVFAALLHGPSLPHLVLHNGLLAPVFGWLILTLARPEPYVSRLLAWRPLVLLGEASFSLYIVHMPLWMWYASVGKRLLGGERPALDFPLYLALSLGASLLLYRAVELPARGALKRLFARRAGTGR
jgi:peptidoglycan/LPS O-acetylase OafA/YrhL